MVVVHIVPITVLRMRWEDILIIKKMNIRGSTRKTRFLGLYLLKNVVALRRSNSCIFEGRDHAFLILLLRFRSENWASSKEGSSLLWGLSVCHNTNSSSICYCQWKKFALTTHRTYFFTFLIKAVRVRSSQVLLWKCGMYLFCRSFDEIIPVGWVH